MLHLGATALLTVTASSMRIDGSPAAQLTVSLPAGLQLVTGETGSLTWPVPALAADAEVRQVLALQAYPAALTTPSAAMISRGIFSTPILKLPIERCDCAPQ